MNMMYYFEKLKLTFHQFTKDGKIPSLVHLEKIMSRCLKLYSMVDSFMKIFKLVGLKEKSDNLMENNVTQDAKEERK